MKTFSCLFAILLVQLPTSTHASPTDGKDCTRIEDKTLRLACYDEFFGRTAAENSDNADSEGTNGDSSAASSGLQAGSATVDDFGAEQIEIPPVTFIEAHLVGDFTGWTGKTVFTLDNGQVWRQTNNYIRNYTPREPIPAPRVTISRGILGSYNMQVEGVKRIVQVRRTR